MVNVAPRGAASLDQGLALLERLAGRQPVRLSDAVRSLGLAPSTARRLVVTLRRRGLVHRVDHGAYVMGPTLLRLTGASPHKLLAETARPIARRLAARVRATIHLGVLEQDMVTYIVKEVGGPADIFSREGLQLEGYCTAIGKMLLASLPAAERERYLAGGPFVALTERTITDIDQLRVTLDLAAQDGFATEVEESEIGLRCLAVPIRYEGSIIAALSVARKGRGYAVSRTAGMLAAAATSIAEHLPQGGGEWRFDRPAND
jgi:IclR family acetate operon transcriptional repressor